MDSLGFKGVFFTLLIQLHLCISLSQVRNPFKPGPYDHAQKHYTPKKDGCFMRTTAHFPPTAGSYTPILFLGGFYDFANTVMYATFVDDLTRHGFIVLAIDRFYMPTPPSRHHRQGHDINMTLESTTYGSDEPNTTIVNQMNWLRQNVHRFGDVRVDWNKTTLMCHSASCDTTLKIVKAYPKYAAASIYIDPMSVRSFVMKPFKTKTVALSYTSEKSFEFPQCCLHGMGYVRFYNLTESFAVRMMVKDVGHCDILDPIFWETCHLSHVCHTGDKKGLLKYKAFTAGMVNAFLRFSLDGDDEMEKYVTIAKNMPLKVTDLAFKSGP